jgi:hypothetical protein
MRTWLVLLLWLSAGCRSETRELQDEVPDLVVRDIRLDLYDESIPITLTVPQTYAQVLTESDLIEWEVGKASVWIIGDSHGIYDEAAANTVCGVSRPATLMAYVPHPDGFSSWCSDGQQSWEYRLASYHHHHLTCRAAQPGIFQALGMRICDSLRLPPPDWKESLKPKTRTGVVVDVSTEVVLDIPSGYKLAFDGPSEKVWSRSRSDPKIKISSQASRIHGEDDRRLPCGDEDSLVIRAREQLADGTLASCKRASEHGHEAWIHRALQAKKTFIFCDVDFDGSPSATDLGDGLAICRSVELPATH